MASVVIVDDDVDIRNAFADVLVERGHDVLLFSDGQEALDALKSADVLPAVILLDLMMPVLDGRAFLELLRADRHLSRLPVVIVTALDPPRVPGANLVVKKPVEYDRLVSLVSLFA